MEKDYSTDLSDGEWERLQPNIPAPNKRGRRRTHGTREVLNAIFYVLKSGCPWRLLPKDFPPWQTVYWWFGRCAQTARSSCSTPLCASGCGFAWAGSRSLARASPT